MEFIDTHCHIQSAGASSGEQTTSQLWAKAPELTADEIIASAEQASVKKLICVGCDQADSQLAIEFVQNRENCFASVGIHPHEASHYIQTASTDQSAEPPAKSPLSAQRGVAISSAPSPYQTYGSLCASTAPNAASESVSSDVSEQFKSLAKNKKVVAIGECGLDYFYEHSPRESQIEILKFQIELALEHDLPMIFHVREAFDDFWPIFESYQSASRRIRGVLHSFTDSQTNLEKALKHNLFIGVNGIATFTKSPEQLAMYKAIPLENLLLETDAPFLTPAPFRGKINEPKYVRVTAEYLADLRNESLEVLAKQTSANARQLFEI